MALGRFARSCAIFPQQQNRARKLRRRFIEPLLDILCRFELRIIVLDEADQGGKDGLHPLVSASAVHSVGVSAIAL